MSSGKHVQINPARKAPGAKGGKRAASRGGKKKAVNSAKRAKRDWEQSPSPKKKVPDDSDDEDMTCPSEKYDYHQKIEVLKDTIKEAKKDAKAVIIRYAQKSYNKVEETLDMVYLNIRDSVVVPPKEFYKQKIVPHEFK